MARYFPSGAQRERKRWTDEEVDTLKKVRRGSSKSVQKRRKEKEKSSEETREETRERGDERREEVSEEKRS